jgi:hypothetical protein
MRNPNIGEGSEEVSEIRLRRIQDLVTSPLKHCFDEIDSESLRLIEVNRRRVLTRHGVALSVLVFFVRNFQIKQAETLTHYIFDVGVLVV